jgi:hypothetical protein
MDGQIFEMFYLIYCVFMLLPTFPYSGFQYNRLLGRNEDKRTAVVTNALGKVDVGLNGVTLVGVQVGTENRDTIVALEVEGDVGSRAGEALTTPLESTIVVADVVVKIESRLDVLVLAVTALGVEDVAVLEPDVLGALVEVDHFCGLWFVCGRRRRVHEWAATAAFGRGAAEGWK